MSLPTKIIGAHRKIYCLDNLGRLFLEAEAQRVLRGTGNHMAAATVAQIDHHLDEAFKLAESLRLHLVATGHEKLAGKWSKVMTGHNISYPFLSGKSEPD